MYPLCTVRLHTEYARSDAAIRENFVAETRAGHAEMRLIVRAGNHNGSLRAPLLFRNLNEQEEKVMEPKFLPS